MESPLFNSCAAGPARPRARRLPALLLGLTAAFWATAAGAQTPCRSLILPAPTQVVAFPGGQCSDPDGINPFSPGQVTLTDVRGGTTVLTDYPGPGMGPAATQAAFGPMGFGPPMLRPRLGENQIAEYVCLSPQEVTVHVHLCECGVGIVDGVGVCLTEPSQGADAGTLLPAREPPAGG